LYPCLLASTPPPPILLPLPYPALPPRSSPRHRSRNSPRCYPILPTLPTIAPPLLRLPITAPSVRSDPAHHMPTRWGQFHPFVFLFSCFPFLDVELPTVATPLLPASLTSLIFPCTRSFPCSLSVSPSRPLVLVSPLSE